MAGTLTGSSTKEGHMDYKEDLDGLTNLVP